ncbi:hypothetical protein [Nocardia stercoris]|uniref:Uncharacterized protein n=1 Tax=Nocardia stercoris TaxID=2483361 RepID=A0A3M2KZY6_9NOCA|nr:hypothetical protein [Nocardia stercoris]RMI29095.1 hypothetical protein EBN03_27035 [Nocardia stercoris]
MKRKTLRHAGRVAGRSSVLLTALATTTVALAGPAAAAPGRLVVDNHAYQRSGPGCVTVHVFPHRLHIANDTALRARIYLLPGCNGGMTTSVAAGRDAAPFGASILLG